jgi:hypothetical protein
LSTKILSGQERRAIGNGGILIGLSQETSCWAENRNPDNVRESQTISGRTGQSPVGGLCRFFLSLRLAWTKSEGAGQCLVGAFGLGVWSGVGFCSNLYFHFIIHTPLNSTVYLNSKKHKNYL